MFLEMIANVTNIYEIFNLRSADNNSFILLVSYLTDLYYLANDFFCYTGDLEQRYFCILILLNSYVFVYLYNLHIYICSYVFIFYRYLNISHIFENMIFEEIIESILF